MSLGDSLNKMSLSADQRKDPVSEAIKKGKIPTLRDVKRSVKVRLLPFVRPRRLEHHSTGLTDYAENADNVYDSNGCVT